MKKIFSIGVLILTALTAWIVLAAKPADTPPTVRTQLLRYPWRGFWVGMFLVEGPKGCILIDTALEDAISKTLEPALKEKGLSFSSIGLVLNTHSHDDHIACNGELKKLAPAAKFPKLTDGAEFSFGGASVRAIATPGHSADSFSLLEPTTGALFTGDSLQGLGTPNVGIALITDPDAYRATLRKVRDLARRGEVRSLYLGHCEPPSRDGFVPQEEIPAFLGASERALDSYIAVTRDFLAKNPQGKVEALRDRLLNECGSRKDPSWRELSMITAKTMLSYVRRAKPSIDKITSLERFGMQSQRDFHREGCAEIAAAGFTGVFINGGCGVCCDIIPEAMTSSDVIKNWMPRTVELNRREIARRLKLVKESNLDPWLLFNGVPGPDEANGFEQAEISNLNDRMFKYEMRSVMEREPELFGRTRWTWRGNRPLCISNPKVKEFYRQLVTKLLTEMPEIKGALYFPGDNEPEQCNGLCPVCVATGKTPQQLMIEHVNAIYAAAVAVKPNFRLYVAIWNHHRPGMEKSAQYVIENLSPGIGMALVMADHVVEQRRAGEFRFNQPWVICPHVGKEFQERAQLAREHSRKIMVFGEIAQSEVWDPVCHNMPNPEKTITFMRNATAIEGCDVIFDFWAHRGPYRGHLNFDAMRAFLDHPTKSCDELLRLAVKKYYSLTDDRSPLLDEAILCVKNFEKVCDEWALGFWCHRFSYSVGRDGARGALFRPLVPNYLRNVKRGWAWSLLNENKIDPTTLIKEQLADRPRFIAAAEKFYALEKKLRNAGNAEGAKKARLDGLNINIAGEVIASNARILRAAIEWEAHDAAALRKTIEEEIEGKTRLLELSGEVGYDDSAGVNLLLIKEDIQNMMYYLSSPDFPDTPDEKFRFTFTPYTI